VNRPVLTGALLAATLAALLGTRLPGTGWQAWAAVAAAGGSVALWGMSLRGRHPWWAPASFIVLGGLFLLPVHEGALLARLPPLAAAVPAAAFLHLSYRSRVMVAPRLRGEMEASPFRRALRFLPLAVALGTVALLPWVAARLLPDRLASLHELRGALGPLAAAALFISGILAGTWLRDALPPADSAAPEPTEAGE